MCSRGRPAGFGIAQANALYFARQGAQFWQDRPQDNLRAVFGLQSEDYTVVAAADAGIETMADLKGKTVTIGEPGSTGAFEAAAAFRHVGVDSQNDLILLDSQRGF